ncbi:MAG: hypothetical protein M1833_007335 [Piccolia ochrophora]|nr:MAG: hypothetical protein M1833_007335 [Piccolia ochrophora]
MELSDPATPLDAPAPLANNDNATNRRKSGRVVKKPAHFEPPPVFLQNGGRGKRKRVSQSGHDDAPEDASSDSSDEGLEDTDVESDAEERRQRKRKASTHKRGSKAKPAAKKPKTAPLGGARTLAVRSAPKTKNILAASNNLGSTSGDLYSKVFSREHTTQDVAIQWVSEFQQNNLEGMRDLINFVLRATGCTLEVTVHDIEDQDNVTGRLADLQDEYQATNITDYPLISRTKGSPPFRSSLVSFFNSIIATIHDSNVLYDELALIENLQVWVTSMSSSAVRPFRHTATAIALALGSKLCEVSSDVSESIAKSRRQLEDEKKKHRSNKARITSIQDKVDEGSQKWTVLEGLIRDIYDTVFVHRYRDVDPKIRSDCVQALGHWIITLPELFFDKQYLRYLGWVLSDTSAPTRLEVVKQLQKLFQQKENIAGLQSFTEKFRQRLVEMAGRDADAHVRALTVELLDQIRETGLLEPDDIDNIGALIFDSDPRVRKAVSPFFAANIDDLYESKIEELGGEESVNEALPGKGEDDNDSPQLSWLKLKCMVELLQAYDSKGDEDDVNPRERAKGASSDVLAVSGVDSRFSLAAQALYDHISEVQEWEVLGGYLLFDHSGATSRPKGRKSVSAEDALKAAWRLDEEAETILLEVLNASVKSSLSWGEDTDSAKKGKKKRAGKGASLEVQETIARHLAQLIPRLLKKFGAIPAAASAVLRLEHVLNLDVFQELRQDETTYSALLDDINKQFLSHANESVLVEASAALLHARSFEELEDVTDGKVQLLWEDTVNALYNISKSKNIERRGTLGNNALTSLLNTVRRISNLASISNCTEVYERVSSATGKAKKNEPTRSALFDILLSVLSRGVLTGGGDSIDDALEDEVATNTLKSALFYFIWKCKTIKEEHAGDDGMSSSDIDNLQDRRDAFAKVLVSIIESRAGVDDLRLTSTGTLLDLHTLFATLRNRPASAQNPVDDTPGNDERISALIAEIKPEPSALVSAIFIASEKAYAKKGHRTLEAGEDDAPIDDESEPESDEDEDEEVAGSERHRSSLIAEQRLCELTAKIVLAMLARVLDHSGPSKGNLRTRLQKNRGRLGPNFKEVVAHLDEPKARKARKELRPTKKIAPKASEELVVEDDEDGEEAVRAAEEGGEDDLRDRELDAREGPPESDVEDDPVEDGDHDGEDEIMGD